MATAAPLDAGAAVTQIYGGTTWKAQELTQYFGRGQQRGQSRDLAYVSVAYQADFSEGGVEKSVVITRLTPVPEDEFRCHACAPVIGGAVFAFRDNGWKIESRAQILGWGTGGGNYFSLLKIGPDRYGVLYRLEDDHQGYEQKRIKLLVPFRGTLLTALSIGFDGSPSPGACEGAQSQSVRLDVTRSGHGSDPGYFDLLTAVQRNEGACGNLVFRTKVTRFVFQNGAYADANTIVPMKSKPADAMEFGIFFGGVASQYDLCVSKGFLPKGARSAEEEANAVLKIMQEHTQDTDGMVNVRKGWDLIKQQIAQRSADFTRTRCDEVAAQWNKYMTMIPQTSAP